MYAKQKIAEPAGGDRELALLEELIAELTERTAELPEKAGDPDALMLEHLEAARFYLTGAMPEEYEFTLRLAKKVLSQVRDPGLHSKIAQFFRVQGHREVPAVR